MALNPVAWYLRSTEGYKMSTMKEKITHLMFVDDLKTFQKSEQKLAAVSNKIKSMMHDMGLELKLEFKCASVHLKRGKYAASENLSIEDSTKNALQKHYSKPIRTNSSAKKKALSN